MSNDNTETALTILVKGEVVDSNFAAWSARLKESIKSLNYELKTDEDFAAADTNAKRLKEAEDALVQAKADALEQAQEVQKLFAAIDDVSTEARQARLSLERQIKKRKYQIRAEIFDSAIKSLSCKRPYAYQSRLEAAMKGKRTFDTLRQAADSEAAVINAELAEAHAAIEVFTAEHGAAAVPDMQSLEVMPIAQLQTELERRAERIAAEAEARKLREEAERLRREAAEKQRKEDEANKAQETPAPQQVEPASNSEGSLEAARFLGALRESFAGAKGARAALRNQQNIDAAQRFSDALAEAWKKLTQEVVS